MAEIEAVLQGTVSTEAKFTCSEYVESRTVKQAGLHPDDAEAFDYILHSQDPQRQLGREIDEEELAQMKQTPPLDIRFLFKVLIFWHELRKAGITDTESQQLAVSVALSTVLGSNIDSIELYPGLPAFKLPDVMDVLFPALDDSTIADLIYLEVEGREEREHLLKSALEAVMDPDYEPVTPQTLLAQLRLMSQ